mmetsp:Transcript_27645/g.79554  ORF Transcript_27645/g.79554 Transcript_27645/m.79554 type:complete len:208 (+) Transcript_27645:1602-2225(+)
MWAPSEGSARNARGSSTFRPASADALTVSRNFEYSASTVSLTASLLVLSTRHTTHPPKPPPVIRAPYAPGCSRASSTMRSISGVETSKLSRSDAWLSYMRVPAAFQSLALSLSANCRHLSFSATTWLARRNVCSTAQHPHTHFGFHEQAASQISPVCLRVDMTSSSISPAALASSSIARVTSRNIVTLGCFFCTISTAFWHWFLRVE